MATRANVLRDPKFTEAAVNKVNYLKTEELGSDTYYFRPGQVLAYHRHKSDQAFFILKGVGKFYLDGGTEEVFEVGEGDMVLAPRGVWHQLANTGTSDLVAVQVTYLPTDVEARNQG